MPDFLIVSLNTLNDDKPKWVGNNESVTFEEFQNKRIKPQCIFFESLTSHQPYFVDDVNLNKMVNILNNQYINKSELNEIYVLENDFDQNKANRFSELLNKQGFENVTIRFFDAGNLLHKRYEGRPYFFQIGDSVSEGNYRISILCPISSKYDNKLHELNRKFNETTIGFQSLNKMSIVQGFAQNVNELLIPVTKPVNKKHYSEELFNSIQSYFENMSWINWLLTRHIFKEKTIEFNLINDLKNEIQKFKNAYDKLQDDYINKDLPEIKNRLKNSTNRLELLTNYFNNPSDELFQIINNYQKPSFTSRRIPDDILKIVKTHHQAFTEIKNKLEQTIHPKRSELIEFVKDYLANNRKNVIDDKIKVMETLLEHLQDPANFEKKNALMEAINTKPNWANHFFKSRTLEAVQKAQELMEADKQVEEIIQPKASITS